jgi:hypothetical protein
MQLRLAPLALTLAALAADGLGVHGLAFYLLLLVIPAAAAAGLDRFASALDGTGPRLPAVVVGLVLALVVLGEAVRAPYLAENNSSALASSTLVAAIALLALQAAADGVAALVAAPRRSA